MTYWLNIAALALFMAAFLFLVFAVASSSRPAKVKSRAVEFGAYFLVSALLTVVNVPAASTVLAEHGQDAVTGLSAVKTIVQAAVLLRVGVLCLMWYGQRIALEKHCSNLEARLKGEGHV